MRKLYIILAIILLAAVSCEQQRTIPRKKLSQIYYDMYLADEAITANRDLRRMTDSLHLYEPIFNKYGYTSEDYLHTVDVYLENPEKYRKIFDRTKEMLEEKRDELVVIYTKETYYDRLWRWGFLDTLDYVVKAEGRGLGFHTWAQFFFRQIDPAPLDDKPAVFSLIVLRPDLDPRRLDSLKAVQHVLDSIRIDSLLRDTLYVPYPLLVDTAADTTVVDSTTADSTMVRTALKDSIVNDFVRAYIFAEHFIIDTVATADTIALTDSIAPTDTVAIADSALITAVTDTIAPVDTISVTDSTLADSTAVEVPQFHEHYGSHIVNFILNDSAYYDGEPYVLAPDTVIVKHTRRNKTRKDTNKDSRPLSTKKTSVPVDRNELLKDAFGDRDRTAMPSVPTVGKDKKDNADKNKRKTSEKKKDKPAKKTTTQRELTPEELEKRAMERERRQDSIKNSRLPKTQQQIRKEKEQQMVEERKAKKGVKDDDGRKGSSATTLRRMQNTNTNNTKDRQK